VPAEPVAGADAAKGEAGGDASGGQIAADPAVVTGRHRDTFERAVVPSKPPPTASGDSARRHSCPSAVHASRTLPGFRQAESAPIGPTIDTPARTAGKRTHFGRSDIQDQPLAHRHSQAPAGYDQQHPTRPDQAAKINRPLLGMSA
jgi:hypothetical protein